MLNGLLLVDKSAGVTSHDVVSLARRSLGTRKVGHAGTLDPMATGLLILGVGPSTRLLTFVVGLPKEYRATIRLGETTLTDDAEGERTGLADPGAIDGLDPDAVVSALTGFAGELDQVPSTVSAIKVDGRRAYARVRAGEEVRLESRRVVVHGIDVGAVRRARTEDGCPTIDIDATIACSSGTYIRAIARDLGSLLGVGGHLTALRRTRIGSFLVGEAVTGDGIEAGRLLGPERAATSLFSPARLDAERATSLTHGRAVPDHGEDGLVAAFDPDGRLIGVAERNAGELRVRANFPREEADA